MKNTGVENAGLENMGPILQRWKRQDHRVYMERETSCNMLYIIGNMQRHTVYSINGVAVYSHADAVAHDFQKVESGVE